MKKTIFFIFILLILTGCSNNIATKTEDTLFSPPTETDNIVGSWMGSNDSFNSNYYFYDDEKIVVIFQDLEEDTWCFLGYWNEDNQNLKIDSAKNYKFNSESNQWDEVNSPIFKDFKFENKEISGITILNDGVTIKQDLKKGSNNFSIPEETDLTLFINDFLIH